LICYRESALRISAVSRAIASSSLVGITSTLVPFPGLEMIISSPRLWLASSSREIPRNERLSHTMSRIMGLFSPNPAVKQMASTPSISAA